MTRDDMRELAETLKNLEGEYHRIMLAPGDKEIIRSRALFGDSQQSILEKAGVAGDRSPDLDI